MIFSRHRFTRTFAEPLAALASARTAIILRSLAASFTVAAQADSFMEVSR
jgi:hypothetical protein